MIAVDTSSLIAFLAGLPGRDVELVDLALQDKQVIFPPVVLTEALSDPKLPKSVSKLLKAVPVLEVSEGYWQRSGALRAKVITKGLRARLADALIAQSCLDHDIGLITRDGDFRHFARYGGLKLFPAG
ncbi:MAG TPA: PIN domain-containing protein [Acidobacteriota bacterium]